MKNYLFMKKDDQESQLASSLLDLKGFDFEIFDVDSGASSELIEKFGIGRVPTLIITDKERITDEARGIEAIKRFIEIEL
ncbi:hypothetical protein H6503_02705 [Candidatus Woesearchaeota archaeon]|nr:hypothetical protein [Candidatus Woesearchaeota archaeon]